MRKLTVKHMVRWAALIVSFIAISIVGNYWAWSQNQAQALSALQHAVNNDMQSLKMYHHFNSSELMDDYLKKRNTTLAESNLEWQMSFHTSLDEHHNSHHIIVWHSSLTHNRISVSVDTYKPSITVILIALLSAIGFYIGCRVSVRFSTSLDIDQKDIKEALDILVIDLSSRQLKFQKSGNSIVLPNKPFCMYLALLQFCSENRNAYLSNRDIFPQRYVSYCHRYLSHLMANGHSRRRPLDFEAGKDKSLSEIRSALESICNDEQQLLQRFLPPKAIGQGSRKVNSNFALQHITTNDFTIIN